MKAEMITEYSGKQISETDLTKIAKKEWTNAGHKASDIKSIELYIQPENSITYYVINDDFKGSFEM